MSMDEQYIDQLKNEIEASRATAKLGEHLERLLKNADFIEVIQKDFCTNNALRCVALLKADSASEQVRKAAIEQLEGISHFQEYLRALMLLSTGARNTISEANNTLDELRGEA